MAVGLLAPVLVGPWAARFLLLWVVLFLGSRFALVCSLRAGAVERFVWVFLARVVVAGFVALSTGSRCGMGGLLGVAPLVEVLLVYCVAG